MKNLRFWKNRWVLNPTQLTTIVIVIIEDFEQQSFDIFLHDIIFLFVLLAPFDLCALEINIALTASLFFVSTIIAPSKFALNVEIRFVASKKEKSMCVRIVLFQIVTQNKQFFIHHSHPEIRQLISKNTSQSNHIHIHNISCEIGSLIASQHIDTSSIGFVSK